jgi:hypothetical protein
MFKKIIVATLIVVVIGLLVFGAVNRTLAKDSNPSSDLSGSNYGQENNGQGHGNQDYQGGQNKRASSSSVPQGELDQNEMDALLYMREEEKLAHDVYLAFAAQWDLQLFQNISSSEQTHKDAIKELIDRYALSDPLKDAAGEFTNPDLQALYDELIAQGSLSLSDALRVGAAIEEIDILDLEKYLAQTDNADIKQVFNNLKSGSENHLVAFVSTLSRQAGETYQPQYLTPEAYQAILDLDSHTDSMGAGSSGNGYHGGRP